MLSVDCESDPSFEASACATVITNESLIQSPLCKSYLIHKNLLRYYTKKKAYLEKTPKNQSVFNAAISEYMKRMKKAQK